MISTLLLLMVVASPPAIGCPPKPGDPPWREITCLIEEQMADAEARKPKPEPVPDSGSND